MPALSYSHSKFTHFVSAAYATVLALAIAGCSDVAQVDRQQAGRFVDSEVQGLFYQTGSATGQTDRNGRFIYRPGSEIRFGLLQNLPLGDGPVFAKATMTPRDIYPGAASNDRRVINLARVLQSLDRDEDTSNGIDLSKAQAELAGLPSNQQLTQLKLNVAPENLAAENPQFMSYLQNTGRELVSPEVAARHLACSEQDIQNGENPDGRCASDPVVISPVLTSISVLEGQEDHVKLVELSLSAATDKTVTVNYETVADSAAAGSDFIAVSGTATFPAGSVTQRIPVTIRGDSVDEDDERFSLLLSSPSNNATLAANVINMIILDDDTVSAPVILTLAPATLQEGAGSTSVTLLRQGQLDRELTIRVKALDGTAKADQDYVRAEEILTIPAQVTSFQIPVTIVQDDLVETDESFSLSVVGVDAGVTVNGSPAIITIQDDDRAEVMPTLSLANLSQLEGDADGVVKVVATLSEPAPRALELHYRTLTGSARSHGERADFVGIADKLIMVPKNAVSVELPITVRGDRFEERDESFSVMASLAGQAEKTATVELKNDEAATLFQVGSAKVSATPSNAQIAGEMESYAGGTRRQFFHLGGYGFGPFKLLPGYGPLPEVRAGEPPLPVSNPPAGARCFSPEISATNKTPATCADEIHVRVMVLMDPKTGERIAFVTMDAIGAGNLIQDAVKAAVNRASCEKNLCIPVRNVMFGQTHTHAGADLQGLWGGVPESWRQQVLVDGTEQATKLAISNSRPARLSMARGDADEFNNYRRPKYRDDSHHQADPAVTLLMAKADDEDSDRDTLVGSMLQYAAHPTSIGNDDYKLPDGTIVRVPHPDYPIGVTEALEERFGAAGLYFNGPIADASPGGATQGSTEYARVKSRGRALAAKAFSYLASNSVAIDPVISVAHKEAVLPVSNPLFIGLGLLSQFNGYYQFSQLPKDDIPGFDQMPPEAIAQFEAIQNQLPQPAPVARTLVSRISLGTVNAADETKNRLEIVTIPGEATNSFGQMIRRLANDSPLTQAKPERHTLLLGLTHNSFGYIIPEEEFSYVDPSGGAGLLVPGTAYEEFVSLGPLTAPLLRAQAYAPLFGVAPPNPSFLPQAITDCQIAFDFGSCFIGVGQDRLMQLLGLPQGLLGSFKDGINFLAEGCHTVAGPLEPACALFDALAEASGSVPGLPGAPGGGAPAPGGGGTSEVALLPEVLQATTRGCDFIDPANCLLPFPNNHFTQAADTETGVRVNFNPLAMPRNVAGKPIDPTDQNRADGFSPGQTLLIRVPGLSLDKTAAAGVPVPRIGKPGFGQQMENSLHPDTAIMVYDVTDNKPHLVWAELDANVTSYTSCDIPAPLQTLSDLGGQEDITNAVQTFRAGCNGATKPLHDARDASDPTSDPGPLLIIRPGINFENGHRYIVALRKLRDSEGQLIASTPGFSLCRDQANSPLRQLPAVAQRCAALDDVMQTLKNKVGIDPKSLYSAWDFTVASERSLTGRLVGMRDQALASGTPDFTITAVEDQPYVASAGDCRDGGATDNCIARVIRGTMTVTNFIDRPVSNTGQGDVDRQVGGKFWFGTPNPSVYEVPKPFPAQPTVSVPFTCHIPRAAFSGSRNTAADTNMVVKPSRVSLYGHGLFGSRGEIGQGQLRRFGGEHNYTFCATDWVGMSGVADVANAAAILLDLSGFPTLSDRVQQGILNFVVMGRLLKAEDGFIADPAFRSADGRPLIDNREVFYDGNSQGGIDGGVVVAVSPDIHRGVLGVPGMNYSTLLQRSVDFDGYARLMYAAYQNTIDQQLGFSLIQMLWDRSENNGYAQNLGDGVGGSVTVAGRTHVLGKPNRTLPGLDGNPLPAKKILLMPGFADHQVSMTSAEVMARTMGVEGADVFFKRPNQCSGDVKHCFANRADLLTQRYPDASPLAGLDLFDEEGYADRQRIAGSGIIIFDEGKTAIPPADNRPPNADDFDPHEYPRNTIIGRCQKARFLRTDGRLVYSDLLATPQACPQMDGAGISFTGDAAPLPPPNTPPSNEQANAGYGSGILGALAEFGANLNTFIAALVNGNFAGAMDAGQFAFTQFGQSLADAFSGDDGPVAAIADAGSAAPNPQSMLERFLDGIGRFLGLQDDPVTAVAAVKAARSAEAVILTGAQLPGWSSPAAIGQGYPYPSGANITGQSGETESLAALNAIRDPLKVGEVQDAHNGMMLYPAAGQVLPLGTPVDEVAAYKWTGSRFEEIPVQVDEKFPFFLANSGSSFSIYSGTDPELTYAWDTENWAAVDAPNNPCKAAYPAGKKDPVAALDDDDEIVFMASDAGKMAPVGQAPSNATHVQMVRLQDATDPQAERIVYVVRQAGGSSFKNTSTYVRYKRNSNADQWIDRSFYANDDPEILGSSNTNYGQNRKGSVCRNGVTPVASIDRFPRDGLVVETDTYRWEATGRWMVRDIRIKAPGVAKPNWAAIKDTRPDLIDRWKGRAFQQSPDSTISLVGFEDEQVNWEANSTLLGERCGPVRCMREVWGADSGTNVTKTETFYRDAVAYRYRIRVHPIPPDGLYTSWDYNRNAMLPTSTELANGVEPGRYFTALRPQGVPVDGINDDLGQIDSVAPVAGQCMTSDGPRPPDAKGRCPLFLDAADPTFNLPLAFNNWEQISGKGNSGSLVYTFALKGATSLANPLVVPYYRDDACLDDGTGDDPVKRPWPGESSADARVIAAYAQNDAIARGGNGNGIVDCEEQQGVYGANGIHYFATHDSDNAFVPVTSTEVDGEQWQFMVPTSQPRNVGDAYSNIIRAPLVAIIVPMTPPSVPFSPAARQEPMLTGRRSGALSWLTLLQ